MTEAVATAPTAAPPAPAAAPAAPAPSPSAPAPAPAVSAPPAPAASPAPTAAPAAATPAPSPAPATAGAPEAYTDFTLPEGMKPDPAILGDLATFAKAKGLTQAEAQQLVDMGAKLQAGNATQLQAALTAQSEQWQQATQADKEIGGDKLQENLAVAKGAIEKFVTPEFKTFLEQTRLGDHPEMIRAFFRIGQAISQDGFVPGRHGGAPTDPAKVMFPSMQ